MLIEAAKGGHTNVVNLLLDYPNSILSPSPDLQQLANTESQLNANEVCMLDYPNSILSPSPDLQQLANTESSTQRQ